MSRELNKKYSTVTPTLLNCLFDAVKLTKHPDIDQQKYSVYGIGFDRGSIYSSANKLGRNAISFGADMGSSKRLIIEKNIL